MQVPPQVVLEGLIDLMANGVGIGDRNQPTAQDLRLATIAATLMAQLAGCRPELAARAADSAAVPCLAALLTITPCLDEQVRGWASPFCFPHSLHSRSLGLVLFTKL